MTQNARNDVICDVDSNSSSQTDNRKKYFLFFTFEILLVLMEALLHQKKSLVLILVKQRRYNDDNSYLFVNEKKSVSLKQIIEMSIFRIIFFQEAYLINLTMLREKKYI